MKLLGFFLLFTLSALAEDCYYYGHPGKVNQGKCEPKENIPACNDGGFRCDETLFGPGLCAPKGSNKLQTCFKKSYQNRKRFDDKPAYEYYSYLSELDKIIMFCLEDKNKNLKLSQCQDLLLIAREARNYFENHTEVVDPTYGFYDLICDPTMKNEISWLNQFIPTTRFKNKNPFPEPNIVVPDLKTNKRGDFCVRDMNMVDTVVLHHTQSQRHVTVEEINSFHISKGWYKAGYHFIIDPEDSRARINQTRTPFMNGAHVGSRSYSKSKVKNFKAKDLGCFTASGNSYPKPDKLVNTKGYVKGNTTTIGIALIGNFAPFDPVNNPTGYKDNENGRLKPKTVKQIASLICHLKGRYPGLKYLKKHKDYKQTLCPGDIEQDLEVIIKEAKEIGCEYSL